jgi:hypothetical protein
VPSLLAMLNDAKWYRIRAMLTILGQIGSSDSIEGLKHTVYHEDDRVRKEAIRCLTKIGGPSAEEILVDLLSDKDASILKQVIFSLGILKSDKALDPLIRITGKWDIFLKSLPLKKEALQTIGLIADRRVLPHLKKIANKSHWFAPKRGEDLRVAVIAVIGQLGDESSLDFLRKMSAKGGPIGRHVLRRPIPSVKEPQTTFERCFLNYLFPNKNEDFRPARNQRVARGVHQYTSVSLQIDAAGRKDRLRMKLFNRAHPAYAAISGSRKGECRRLISLLQEAAPIFQEPLPLPHPEDRHFPQEPCQQWNQCEIGKFPNAAIAFACNAGFCSLRHSMSIGFALGFARSPRTSMATDLSASSGRDAQ